MKNLVFLLCAMLLLVGACSPEQKQGYHDHLSHSLSPSMRIALYKAEVRDALLKEMGWSSFSHDCMSVDSIVLSDQEHSIIEMYGQAMVGSDGFVDPNGYLLVICQQKRALQYLRNVVGETERAIIDSLWKKTDYLTICLQVSAYRALQKHIDQCEQYPSVVHYCEKQHYLEAWYEYCAVQDMINLPDGVRMVAMNDYKKNNLSALYARDRAQYELLPSYYRPQQPYARR